MLFLSFFSHCLESMLCFVLIIALFLIFHVFGFCFIILAVILVSDFVSFFLCLTCGRYDTSSFYVSYIWCMYHEFLEGTVGLCRCFLCVCCVLLGL